MKRINTTKGKTVLVDDEMYEYLNQWKWSVNNGYAVRHQQKNEYRDNPRRMIKMHRLIMKVSGKTYVDHINRNKLDNRINNLRIASNSENQANAKLWKTNTSGYRGVVLCNMDKPYKVKKPWGVRIMVRGRKIFKGMFETPQEAAKAYNKLAKKYFGEYAFINK